MKSYIKRIIAIWIVLVSMLVLYFVLFSDTTECGNFICEEGETYKNCPKDCSSEFVCGDYVCSPHEDSTSCPQDCGYCYPLTCYDIKKQCGRWSDGCGGTLFCGGCSINDECVNGRCENVIPTRYCGDGMCDGTEDCSSCPTDCGFCVPECGNGICQVMGGVDEFISCPQDCGIVCGDNECVIDPYDERIHCPQDCKFLDEDIGKCGDGICQIDENIFTCNLDCNPEDNNMRIIQELRQEHRPLVAGLEIEDEREVGFAKCTLGMIIKHNNKNYLLTAGHCVSIGEDGIADPSDIGLLVKQGSEIGEVYMIDEEGGVDAALVSLNSGVSSTTYTDYLGNKISGFGTVTEGMKVYKIGRTTGLTFGTVFSCPTCTEKIAFTDLNGNLVDGFEVIGDNGMLFAKGGDSGSAIITASEPHVIVGILSACSPESGLCASNMADDIKSVLDID